MKRENLLLIADSDRDADVRYATGFLTTDPFIWLQCDGRSYGMMNDLEIDRARAHSTMDRIVPLAPFWKRLVRDGVESPGLADMAALLCYDLLVKRVVVPARFPVGLARRRRKLGVKGKLREGLESAGGSSICFG